MTKLEKITTYEHQEIELAGKYIKKLKGSKLPEAFFNETKNGVKFKSYVGNVNLFDKQIEILPKINKSNDGIRKSLIHMISVAEGLNIYSSNQSSLSTQNYTLIDYFIKNFIELLKKEINFGLIREYKEKQEYLNTAKGKILITQTIKNNAWDNSNFYSSFDEFSQDNTYNQIIKAALIEIKKLTVNNRLIQDIELVKQYFENVSSKEITLNDFRYIENNSNRLMDRYSDIFHISKLILTREYFDILFGDKNSAAIIFDMNKLFEKYIAFIINKICKRSDYSSRNKYHNLFDEGFRLEPDFQIKNKNNNKSIIIDTKWKELNTNPSARSFNEKYGIKTSDIYQMTSYGLRYQVKNLVLLFPMSENNVNDDKTLKYKDLDMTLDVSLIDLSNIHIDKGKSVEKDIKKIIEKFAA